MSKIIELKKLEINFIVGGMKGTEYFDKAKITPVGQEDKRKMVFVSQEEVMWVKRTANHYFCMNFVDQLEFPDEINDKK